MEGSGSISAAPVLSAPNKSYTDKSKAKDDTPKNRSFGPISNRRLMSSIVLVALAWDIITPLGVPVEPEVKIT